MATFRSIGQVALLFAILLGSIAFSLALQSPVVVPSSGSIHYPAEYTFGIVGSAAQNSAINNFCWLFSNQSISYRNANPSQISNLTGVGIFDGLVVWTRGDYTYNATAIKLFAQTHVVICDIRDFCESLYPSLSVSLQVVSTNTVTYNMDWGNFRAGDLVEMRNETGNTNQLTTVLTSSLTTFANITTIARYDANRTAILRMNGTTSNSGFYAMDLDATTPSTEWAGIWHLFPAIKLVKDFPTGTYARWLTSGVTLFTYDEAMNRLGSWVSSAPKGMNASLIRIGRSVLGRDINATRFGNGSRYITVNAATHGNERVPPLALLRLLQVIQEDFVANGPWKKRLAEISMIVIPILNPDGYVNDTRENANGKDLNRQFPPETTTEPEAWALRWLWGNYSTFLYIDDHEGYYWYPSNYDYAPYLPSSPVDVRAFTNQNCYWTADDFEALQHWGYFTYNGSNVNIGKVKNIWEAATNGTTHGGASLLYNISSCLLETFIWSDSYKARQQLWAMDFYISTIFEMASHFDRLRADNFLIVTQSSVKSFIWTSPILRLVIDTSKANATACITKIDVGDRPKPLHVFVDYQEKIENNGWTFNSGILSITGAQNSIEISW